MLQRNCICLRPGRTLPGDPEIMIHGVICHSTDMSPGPQHDFFYILMRFLINHINDRIMLLRSAVRTDQDIILRNRQPLRRHGRTDMRRAFFLILNRPGRLESRHNVSSVFLIRLIFIARIFINRAVPLQGPQISFHRINRICIRLGQFRFRLCLGTVLPRIIPVTRPDSDNNQKRCKPAPESFPVDSFLFFFFRRVICSARHFLCILVFLFLHLQSLRLYILSERRNLFPLPHSHARSP